MMSASSTLSRQTRSVIVRRQNQSALSLRNLAAKNNPRRSHGLRFQSTSAGSSTGSASMGANNSHIVSGLVGGGITLVGVYGYYHYSGLKSVVDTTHSIQTSMKNTAKAAADKLPNNPSEVLDYIRGVAKSYASLIPGGASAVDHSFNTLDELRQTHGEQVDAILSKTYEDIRKVVQKGGFDSQTASKIYEILREQGTQLAKVANEVGADVLEKHPELKEKLGGGWDELQRLAKEAGDSDVGKRARQIRDDTTKAVSDIFQKGLSADSIAKAKELIDTKSKEIKELTEKAAKQAWEKGMKEYGDKVPDNVKSILSQDNMTALMAGGGAGAIATIVAIWDRIKDMASKKGGFDEKSVEEFKRFVEDKLQDAKGKSSVGVDTAWKTARSWLGTVPGGQKALDRFSDIDVSALTKLAQSRGADAEKLLEETYGDLLKVLDEKSKKAKKLAEETKQEAKDKAQ